MPLQSVPYGGLERVTVVQERPVRSIYQGSLGNHEGNVTVVRVRASPDTVVLQSSRDSLGRFLPVRRVGKRLQRVRDERCLPYDRLSSTVRVSDLK